MKRIIFLVVSLTVGGLISGTYLNAQEHPAGQKPQGSHQAGEGQKSKLQTKCPVMGGKIDQKLYADHDGKRVYFCCPMCVGEFKKDPAKYIKKLEDEGVVPELVPGA